ncbi:MAG TPA: lamin tail domain-containing protein, partial [Chitinophagaceae bacterium]|nr:lamin tail domain-containing protein [Chitinophagaceae bacterium]
MRKLYIFALLFIASISSNAQVISQVFAGGGNAGAPFTNDYVEIFNNTGSELTLTNYSIQYATGASVSGNFAVLATINTTLLPGQYYLVQLGTATGSNVPADLTGSNTNLAVGGGKVILVSTNTAVAVAATGCSVTPVIDFVGYGTANCAEGTAAAAMTNTTALLRAS